MKKIIWKLLNLLYPRCCPVCHKILKDQKRLICPDCAGRLKPIRQPFCQKCGRPVEEGAEYCRDCRAGGHLFSQGRAIFLYNKEMKDSLIKYKYYGRREYGDFYGTAMCRYAEKEILRWRPDVIVPVPLHPGKQRMRGFNQAEYLARKIGSFYGIPVSDQILRKTGKTRSQKKLGIKERKKNLKGAFSVSRRLDGLTILIVDDVYTTGSTMDAAAECLWEKGAGKIYFLTLCIGQN